MNSYSDFLMRKQNQFGAQFDPADLDARFIPYFENGARIKVEVFGRTITGTVGVTSGRKPAFLLMRTVRSMGSCEVLGPDYKLVAVRRGRIYAPLG